MLNRSRNRSTNSSAPPATSNWRSSSRDYGYSEPNSYDSSYGQLLPYGSQSSRANPPNSRGSIEELRSFARQTPSFGSASFPTHHNQRSPVQIIIFDPQPASGESSPWARRAGGERHARPAGPNAALESLKREFYNPRTKRITNTVNLYYRDTPVDPRDIANEEDGKRCSVCLEDFERGNEVMVTPCKHMFHGDCIVPWARTNPHCPVCRSALGPKPREASSSYSSSFSANNINTNNNNHYDDSPGLTTQEFLSILRALGDGFQL